MMKNTLKFVLASAAMVFAVGCGDLPSGMDASNTCSTDANCGTGKVCHPVLRACVNSCTGGSDCPSSAKTCAKFDGTAATAAAPGFCQCSTDALCNPGGGALVCSPATKQCESKCSSTSCPTGYSCNADAGVCTGNAVVDAGTDAGVVDAGTMMVDAGTPCASANPQPDICGYGKSCGSDNKCAQLADGTCSNVTAATTAGNHVAWTPSSTGHIISSIENVSADDDVFCGAGNYGYTGKMKVYASPTLLLSDTLNGLPNFKYFKVNGTVLDLKDSIKPTSGYANGLAADKKTATIIFTICSPTLLTQVQAAFAFTNGNAMCVDLDRN